ncbi:MAG: uroporphyrinogen decarboxylase [Deltaproteobacteria bacterium]|nr:uroporphyrinogen decarboxylase [Deltaproteobacteria bacterium]|tara:strand:+ start:586 stop:1620 length:1035 start_codon:yes stop_codon:yes gene_type:complete
MNLLENDRLLRVLNHLPVDRVPVWIMRQAGRTDPEYKQLRKEDGRPLEKIFSDVELSIKISLLPKKLGVDAIIMFQDILTPLTPTGTVFHFTPGPFLEDPIRTMNQVKAIRKLDSETQLVQVGKIIRGINEKLGGELPLLGFAGSPMSLAFFLIAGSQPNQKHKEILAFINEYPVFTKALLERLTELTINYLNYQISSGVHAVQLFESFADVISLEIYEKYVQPTHEKIFSALNPNIPSILFTKESPHIELMLQSGSKALSVGNSIDLETAKKKAPEMIFQGNVDNKILADGSKGKITKAVEKCFAETNRRNHILNLNHGLLERTPFENVQHFVDVAKKLGKIN